MTPDEFNMVRRTLISLLVRVDDEPVDITELDYKQRLFLIHTSSAEMIITTLCAQTGFIAEDALEGLEAIYDDMKRNLIERCKEVN